MLAFLMTSHFSYSFSYIHILHISSFTWRTVCKLYSYYEVLLFFYCTINQQDKLLAFHSVKSVYKLEL